MAARGNWLRPRPPARGRLATANPKQGAAARKGNNPQGVATHGRGRLLPARKRLPTVHPQGAARGVPTRGCHQQGWRRRLQPTASPPAQG
ncbi:hypothetical protein GW17_00045180 [Ensete ventricosum]|nr:hypothetical protein GW17_00045180 [Ensete ventricosum]RZS26771.1 hypothetical protein BHM03_00060162 [Ensete ventricosum]